ncbi:MAG: DUF3179 domain-containing protein [Saprospiraceae bacterium]|nr:MAG: DUF3179 domain-containing protein [Saprospiraceae bacterium]
MEQLHFKTTIIYAATCFLLAACNGNSDQVTPGPGPGPGPGPNDTSWLIPKDQVFDGGPGKDGIPSIDNPQFSPAGSISFLAPGDLVLGVKVGDEIRAYPHPILDWHEIVNDEVNGIPMAITYCPLTGTGIGWDRTVGGSTTTFGVSGLLYNTNLIPYDRASGSNWSQMLLKSVNGSLKGEFVKTYPLIETTWQTWQSMFPDSKVLNTNTGYNRNYGVYPYGTYKTNHDQLLFPVDPDDERLLRKTRGLGVIVDGEAKFYRFNKFDAQVTVQQDVIKGVELVVVGSSHQNFLTAFERKLADGTLLEFTAIVQSGNPVVMKDNEGNEWNLFGEAVSGPRTGERLAQAESFIGYWFSWGAFYPGLEIF